jgi:hypothetical protein
MGCTEEIHKIWSQELFDDLQHFITMARLPQAPSPPACVDNNEINPVCEK